MSDYIKMASQTAQGPVGFDGRVYYLTMPTLWDVQLNIFYNKTRTGGQDKMTVIVLTPFSNLFN